MAHWIDCFFAEIQEGTVSSEEENFFSNFLGAFFCSFALCFFVNIITTYFVCIRESENSYCIIVVESYVMAGN